jgi:hypothetical protein
MKAGPLDHPDQVDKEDASDRKDKADGAPMGDENQSHECDGANGDDRRADQFAPSNL